MIRSLILFLTLAVSAPADHYVNVELGQPAISGRPKYFNTAEKRAEGWRPVPTPYPQPPAIGEPIPPPKEVFDDGGKRMGWIVIDPTERSVGWKRDLTWIAPFDLTPEGKLQALMKRLQAQKVVDQISAYRTEISTMTGGTTDVLDLIDANVTKAQARLDLLTP